MGLMSMTAVQFCLEISAITYSIRIPYILYGQSGILLNDLLRSSIIMINSARILRMSSAAVVKVRGLGGLNPLLPFEPPAIV